MTVEKLARRLALMDWVEWRHLTPEGREWFRDQARKTLGGNR